MTTMTAQATQVYQVFIKASPEAIWDAITKPEFTSKYFYGMSIETTADERRTYDGSEFQDVAEVFEFAVDACIGGVLLSPLLNVGVGVAEPKLLRPNRS